MNIAERNFFRRPGELCSATRALVADDYSSGLQLEKNTPNDYGVCVKAARNVFGGVQFLRLGSEQDERVDGGRKSRVERHAAKLPQSGSAEMKKLFAELRYRIEL